MKDQVLLRMNSHAFHGYQCATTVTSRSFDADERLILEQPTLRDELEAGDDECVILDRDTQHALYLLLKNRFGE